MTGSSGSLLVRGRWVVTGAVEDDATISDGAVLVRDGKVEQVGAWPALRQAHPDAEVLGSDDVAILPGLSAPTITSPASPRPSRASWTILWSLATRSPVHAPGRPLPGHPADGLAAAALGRHQHRRDAPLRRHRRGQRHAHPAVA